ncbi:Flagellar transcriptional regulator FlhC [compost metagenome]
MSTREKRGASRKSVLRDAEESRLAIEMIGLGARLQVLEAELSISRERLTRLYRELRGESPPKGQLPFSPDWFLTWRPNVHSSMFLSAMRFLEAHCAQSRVRTVLSAYRLYLEQVGLVGEEAVMSFTRAWTLTRFADSGVLDLCTCTCCGGRFVRHTCDLQENFVCGLCAPPPRAAKGSRERKRQSAELPAGISPVFAVGGAAPALAASCGA